MRNNETGIENQSEKRFRFTLTAKIQGYALNTIENLCRANEVYVKPGSAAAIERRLAYQRQALTELNLLGYLAQLSMEQTCITAKQYEQITRKIYDCKNLLGAWIKSDQKSVSGIPAFRKSKAYKA